MRKSCSMCQREKSLDEFSRNCHMSDGRLNRCRECEKVVTRARYKSNPRYRANAVWSALLQRIGNSNGKNPSYAAVELRMTKEEFIEWVIPKYAEFLAQHPGESPSIDRIDPNGHYEISNLRVIPLAENCRLSPQKHNLHAPEGQAWRTACKAYKSRSEFYKNRCQPHGLQHRCKLCVKQRRSKTLLHQA